MSDEKDHKEILELFAVGTSLLSPCLALFESYAPPMFPQIGWLVVPMALAAVYGVWRSTPKGAGTQDLRVLFTRGYVWLCAAVLLVIIYITLLNFTTAIEPQSGTKRFSIGFQKADWSLTETGKNIKKKSPDKPVEEWLLAEAGFRPNGPAIIWKDWSIYLAGGAQMLVYVVGFVSWATGFGYLAKHYSSTK